MGDIGIETKPTISESCEELAEQIDRACGHGFSVLFQEAILRREAVRIRSTYADSKYDIVVATANEIANTLHREEEEK